MERWQRYLILGLAALVASFAVFSAGFALGKRDGGRVLVTTGGVSGDGSNLVQEAFDRIMSTAVDPPDPDALARGAIKGMVDALGKNGDPYAFFYTPSGYRSLRELTTGKFSGHRRVAEGEGRQARDRLRPARAPRPTIRDSSEATSIVAIDGDQVGDMTTDEAVALIKGPEGTDVALGIDQGGRLSQLLDHEEPASSFRTSRPG